jgi:hypothetical protein
MISALTFWKIKDCFGDYSNEIMWFYKFGISRFTLFNELKGVDFFIQIK